MPVTRRRMAFTLLELTVVIAVLGVVALVASTTLNTQRAVESLATRQESQTLTAALRAARMTAIASTAAVRVEAIRNGRLVSGYRTCWDATPNVVLQPDYSFPNPVVSTWSQSQIVFQPTGMSDRSLTVQLEQGVHRWTLDVFSGSGQVTAIKTAP